PGYIDPPARRLEARTDHSCDGISPTMPRLLLLSSIVLLATLRPAIARAQALPPPNPMQSGGLAPPPPGSGPVPPAPMPSTDTQRRLEEADARDSGRGLEFVYFNLEGGFSYAGLGTLHETGALVPTSSKTSGAGALWGVAAGALLLFFTLGPRFRME